VLVAAFTLRALKKTFFGDLEARSESVAPSGDVNHPAEVLAPISGAEKWGAGLLMFATLAAGVYPKLLLDRILPAVEAMRFLKP
jgi:NADH-quinone oxidoreductase subunit M